MIYTETLRVEKNGVCYHQILVLMPTLLVSFRVQADSQKWSVCGGFFFHMGASIVMGDPQ